MGEGHTEKDGVCFDDRNTAAVFLLSWFIPFSLSLSLSIAFWFLFSLFFLFFFFVLVFLSFLVSQITFAFFPHI